MTTTALLCVARNEQPFTEEWLEYHLGIGFDRVVYVSTDPDISPIRELIDRSAFRSRVELSHFDTSNRGWQVRCYNQHLQSIREDWVLPLDVDEFLYLHSWGSLQDFLDSAPAAVNQIQFPWLNLISSDYWHERTFDLLNECDPHVSDHVKSIARVRDVAQLGVHAHSLHDSRCILSSGLEVSASSRHDFLLKDPGSRIDHPLILHFCSRGHMDALIRIVEQGFFNQKCGSPERQRLRRYLQETPDWANLPTRYMLLQLWSSMPKVSFRPRLPQLASRTEVRGLKATFRDIMKRLLGFEAPIEDVAERFEARYHFAHKIRAQNQTARYDVDEYLKHPTQLGYIEDRRKFFESRSAGVPLTLTLSPKGRGDQRPDADGSQPPRATDFSKPRRSFEGTSFRGRQPPLPLPVFIHISKNAGSSIVRAGGVGIINAGHQPARSWAREHGNASPLFAVIRNPFDRVVSEYFYRKRRFDRGDRNGHLSNLRGSFEDWALSTFRDGEFRTRAFFEDSSVAFHERNMVGDRLIWFVPQVDWLGDGDGRLLVHDLLRFENLKWDWKHFAKKHALGGTLSRRNASKRRRDYRSYYSAETRKLIGDYYREDLEAFGYAF